MGPIYNIDYNTLIKWLVPPVLRNEFMLNWIKALISPLISTYLSFIRYYNDISYKLSITPQVCYLQKILNDTFDNELRRIYITDPENYIVTLIHTDDAQNPLITHLDSSLEEIPIIHDDSAYESSGNDFNVIIPFVLSQIQEYQLKTILNTYKLPSKRYKLYYI
jgi:hypothetical protein